MHKKIRIPMAVFAMVAAAAFGADDAPIGVFGSVVPVPVTYIMVCCHGADKGTKFLANGEWDTKHDYRDYAFARDQMQKIKEAGINVVGVDFTNPSQWDQFKAHHWPMLENVAKAAAELDIMSAGSTDLARFVAPNSGVGPKEWARVDANEWRRRVKWCLGAKEYAVIGTYDDTCDCIFWGIADVSEARNKIHVHESTKSDPYAYYNIVKEEIAAKMAAFPVRPSDGE